MQTVKVYLMRSRPNFFVAALLLTCFAGLAGWALGGVGNGGPTSDIPLLSQVVQTDDLEVTLAVTPSEEAVAAVDITVRSITGTAPAIGAVQLRTTLTEVDGEVREAAAEQVGAGHYRVAGPVLARHGRWLVEAVLERPDGRVTTVPFGLRVGQSGVDAQPLVMDEQTLLAGRSLYVANCASCHGATGQGNAEYVRDNGRAMPDMTKQMAPGLRTDGQLFGWTKNGISGTSMPGYGLVMNDTETWQVIAYLRTFAMPNPPVGVDQAALATEQAAPTPVPPVPTRVEPLPPLVFVRDGDLWRSDGKNGLIRLTRIANDLAFVDDLALAPDGTEVAFTSITLPSGTSSQITSTLHTIRLDGTGAGTLWESTSENLTSPTWLPDGSGLVVATFVALDQPDERGLYEQYEIVRVDRISGARQTLVRDARSPAVSLDGTQLAYVKIDVPAYTTALEIAQSDGTGARRIADVTRFDDVYAPRFAPDGSRLVFAAAGGPQTDGAGNPVAVRPAPLAPLWALWAPAVAEAHGAPFDLWLMNTDGSGLRRLTVLFADNPRAAFSLDGAEIVFLAADGIYRLNSDGTNLRRIDEMGAHGGLVWTGQ
jgi:mono/diheme cytochrome c family protein